MRNFISKKTIYLLGLLVISLLGLVILPTYALFYSDYETDDDIAGLSLNFDIGITNVEEYETVKVDANYYSIFNVQISNAYSDVMYYGVWYRLEKISDENPDIIVARYEHSETATYGEIDDGETKTVSIIIKNKTNVDIEVSIGVASSTTSTSNIEYLSNKHLISGTATKVFPNVPNIDNGNLIPVYYDNTDEVWKKAGSTNKDNSWYDYDKKKWANAVIKDPNTIVDLSNNLNNATNVGATWDKTNKTISTDGVDDYVNLGFANYDFGSDVTFVFRTKFASLDSTTKYLFNNLESGGGGFSINSDNTIRFQLQLNGSYVYCHSTFIPTVDTWYTFVGTYDGSNINVYANGTNIYTTAASGSIGVSTAPLVLGGNPTVEGVTPYNDTIASEVLIFDRALTETEIIADYSGAPNPSDTTDLLAYYDFSDGNNIPVGTVISDSVSDGTLAFYVWIPRFKYRVWNITRQAGAESTYAYKAFTEGIEIEFESGTASTGNVACSYDITSVESDTNLSDKCYYNDSSTAIATTDSNSNYTDAWYTHPAFTFGGVEKTGFWMGKFEPSGTLAAPTIIPDVETLDSVSVSEGFTASRVFQNYLSNSMNSHMTTNLEWGAVAYLTHSVHGLCDGVKCTGINHNNSAHYTGRSGGANGARIPTLGEFYGVTSEISTNIWNGNGYYNYRGYLLDKNGTVTTTKDITKVASTTGNITGIYDMSGGHVDLVMANMVDSSGAFTVSRAGSSWNGSSTLDSKYYNAYSYGTNENGQLAYNRARLGDNTAEILGSSSSTTGGWKPGISITGSYSRFLWRQGDDYNSWLGRGGTYEATSTGTFYFRYSQGNGNATWTFRAVIS